MPAVSGAKRVQNYELLVLEPLLCRLVNIRKYSIVRAFCQQPRQDRYSTFAQVDDGATYQAQERSQDASGNAVPFLPSSQPPEEKTSARCVAPVTVNQSLKEKGQPVEAAPFQV